MLREMTPEAVLQLLENYPISWANNFKDWLERDHNLEIGERAKLFKSKLQQFGAHRPYRIVNTEDLMNDQPGPYLDEIMSVAEPLLFHLNTFDLSVHNPITEEHEEAISNLYDALRGLRYDPTTYEDKTTIMVKSKALHLQTDGKVGPAFDSKVVEFMVIAGIKSADEWIASLKKARQDVIDFEESNQCNLFDYVPERFQHLFRGRIYDMIAVTEI